MDSLERIAETFEFFEDREDRYHYLTEWAKAHGVPGGVQGTGEPGARLPQ